MCTRVVCDMNVHVACVYMCIVHSPMQVHMEATVDIKMSSPNRVPMLFFEVASCTEPGAH